MRILFDESLLRRLSCELLGHTVTTVAQSGWTGLENGELFRVAAEKFAVFLTPDQNIEYQQNVRTLPLAVIVLVVRNNTFETLRRLMPDILNHLERLEPRSLVKIG